MANVCAAVVVCLAAATAFGQVTVTVSSPSSGASVSSPFTVKASAKGTASITGWYIYADNKAVWHTSGTSSISATISLSTGSHSIRVRAWQSGGAFGDDTLSVKVASTTSDSTSSTSETSGLPTPPSTAKVLSTIEDTTSNWKSCSACGGGANTTSNYWTAPFQSSPSLDGSSREFYNGGGPWTNVLWIKSLGAQNSYKNFIWDFWVRFDSGAASHLWTAEFDLWQAVNHQEFMIGSQCNFGQGLWDVWNAKTNSWIHTSVACNRFAANTWHHIQWYVQRVSSNQYRYRTLVVDGVSHTVDKTFYTNWISWADSAGIQWQLDLDSSGIDAHQWIDKVKLTMW